MAHKGIVALKVNRTLERTFYDGSRFTIEMDRSGANIETARLWHPEFPGIYLGDMAIAQAARLTASEEMGKR